MDGGTVSAFSMPVRYCGRMNELLVGYARLSTERQGLTAQRDGLHALDPSRLSQDVVTAAGYLEQLRLSMRPDHVPQLRPHRRPVQCDVQQLIGSGHGQVYRAIVRFCMLCSRKAPDSK